MNKPIKYTKGPIGSVRIVDAFLPPPRELAAREDVEKVTIALSKRSVDFFRNEAKKHGTQDQKMIRLLLDQYAVRHAASAGSANRVRER